MYAQLSLLEKKKLCNFLKIAYIWEAKKATLIVKKKNTNLEVIRDN